MSQYLMQQVSQIIRTILERAGIHIQNRPLFDIILTEVNNPGSSLCQHLVKYLNDQTQGRWQNGVHPDQMALIIKPWLNEALNHIHRQMTPVQQPAYGGYQPQQGYPPQGGYGGGYGGGYQPPYAANTTSGLYDTGGSSQPPPIAPLQPFPATQVDINTSERNFSMDSFDRGTPISITLNDADTLQHHPKEGNVVSLDNYREGVFEDMRISTIDIILNTAENNSADAGKKALLYSPNEVLRGLYANVISYKEIFYIPMRTSEFKRISHLIGTEFYGLSNRQKPEWRNAVKAMGALNRAEHRLIETALLRFLNPSIFKFLRASNGDYIERIDEIDDLNELDNPRSKLKVTQHASYLNIFNEIVTRAFDTLINPSHLIEAEDKNFGDFVHCDQIEFWHDERTKYDYGTYADKADRMKFIERMTDRHTVLRVKKNTILTNAIDERVANNITHFRGKDSVPLTSTNNIGCKLLLELDQPKRSEIEKVVCIGDNDALSKSTHLVNLGRTLDGHLVLIK